MPQGYGFLKTSLFASRSRFLRYLSTSSLYSSINSVWNLLKLQYRISKVWRVQRRSNYGQKRSNEGQMRVEAFLDIRLESWLDGSSSSILSIFAMFWTSEVISLGWIGTGWVLVVRGWIGVGTVGLFEFSGLVGLWWILVPYNGFSGSKSGR